jgi:hypothetical protein
VHSGCWMVLDVIDSEWWVQPMAEEQQVGAVQLGARLHGVSPPLTWSLLMLMRCSSSCMPASGRRAVLQKLGNSRCDNNEFLCATSPQTHRVSGLPPLCCCRPNQRHLGFSIPRRGLGKPQNGSRSAVDRLLLLRGRSDRAPGRLLPAPAPR